MCTICCGASWTLLACAKSRETPQASLREAFMQAARDKAAKPSIVITELPYQTNKSDFVATVARLVEEQKLTGAGQVIVC